MAEFFGVATDPNGNAIPNMNVAVSSVLDSNVVLEVIKTDTRGRFNFTLDSGEFDLYKGSPIDPSNKAININFLGSIKV